MGHRPPLRLLTAAFPGRAAFETAASRALLERVGLGQLPETFRMARTGRILSLGRQDIASPGLPDALAAARERGFVPVRRVGGGRAAVFHEGTLAFGHAVADPAAAQHARGRFSRMATLLAEALQGLDLPVEVGELPGEYCPGTSSLHLGGLKLVGIAQRVTARGAYTEGVIVVRGGDAVREVLVPVYAALGLDWDPATAGALGDAEPEVTLDDVEMALTATLAAHFALDRRRALDPVTAAPAAELETAHAVETPGPQPAAV
jgi:octanoyl-[GcvH]:protein N-octanoyltransferase